MICQLSLIQAKTIESELQTGLETRLDLVISITHVLVTIRHLLGVCYLCDKMLFIKLQKNDEVC